MSARGYVRADRVARPGHGVRFVPRPSAPTWTKARERADKRAQAREREKERRQRDPVRTADELVEGLLERYPFLRALLAAEGLA